MTNSCNIFSPVQARMQFSTRRVIFIGHIVDGQCQYNLSEYLSNKLPVRCSKALGDVQKI